MMFRVLVAALMLPALALAIPPVFTDLWPDAEGLHFEYDFHYESSLTGNVVDGPAWLEFGEEVGVPAGTARILRGRHPQIRGSETPGLSGLALAAWRMRPGLREEIEAHNLETDRHVLWHPVLLHTGLLLKTPETIEMWQPGTTEPTWLFLESDVYETSSFSFSLLGGITDDIVLHGMVTETGVTIETAGGTYENAVKVQYFVDMGIEPMFNGEGMQVGESSGSVRGYVSYAPDVGPVEVYEEWVPIEWFDCWVYCPEFPVSQVGQVSESSRLLLNRAPVANEDLSWSDLKAMYR